MNTSKNILSPIIFTFLILSSIQVYAQFGIKEIGLTTEELVAAYKARAERSAKREAERKRIIKHNEWVRSESNRLNNGKQTGIIIMMVGGIITSIGVIMYLKK